MNVYIDQSDLHLLSFLSELSCLLKILKLRKIMSKILILLVILFSVILYSKIYFSGEKVQIADGTGKSFEIYRDSKGIPHIFSHSVEDTMFGWGYAEGEDRLWALMVKKFLIEGRMSELFGREGLPSDYFSRNFKFYDVGVMNTKLLDE